MGNGGAPYFRPGNRLTLTENNHTAELAISNGVIVQSIDGGADSPIGGSTLPITAILADATTNSAPDGIVERHTTSGTAAAGFGLADAIELQSAAGNVRRVMTDVTTLTTATDAAEVAKRVISLMDAGALQACLTITRGVYTFASAASNQADLVIGATSCKVSLDQTTLHLQLTGGARDVCIGPAGALATNAALGHFQIPTCAGAPTGSAALMSGKAALLLDTTNSKLWVSSTAGTWKGVVVA